MERNPTHRHGTSALSELLYDSTLPGDHWKDREAAGKQSRASRLVIVARWFCIAMLAGYGLISAAFYAGSGDFELVSNNIAVPVLALGVAIAYNAWFHFSYQWFLRFRYLAQAQLVFDLAVVTVVIHFSGGVVSWFWSVYLLVTIEAAFVLESQLQVLAIGAVGGLMYGALLVAELGNAIHPVPMPLVQCSVQHSGTYVGLLWTWVAMMNTAAAVIGGGFAQVIRKKEAALQKLVVIDPTTGLHNRDYFFQRLHGEIQRCRQFGRSIAVLLVEVDGFAAYTAAHGHDAADELLQALGGILKTSANHGHGELLDSDFALVCRLDGCRFGILLPEAPVDRAKTIAGALQTVAASTAEVLRSRISRYVSDRRGVTLSVGVANYDRETRNADHLVQRAGQALQQAITAGGNQIRVYDVLNEWTAQPSTAG